MRHKKLVKITMVSLSCIIVGLICLLAYNSIGVSKPSDANIEDTNKPALINALENYFGEWEIVEDYGYHGIHRMTEIEVFEVGKSTFFREDTFCYEDKINVLYPNIMIEITSSEKMQQMDRMEYPHHMGFDNHSQYAKIMIYDYHSSSDVVCNFYILNDNEIIIEGDTHRYYRAVKKN